MNNQPERRIVFYTDGGCRAKPVGLGAWAYVKLDPKHGELRMSGVKLATTNNRMELMAFIEALGSVPEGASVVVKSDSQYVIKGLSEWSAQWVRSGWRTSSDKPVKNKDLWVRLLKLYGDREVYLAHVRGHTGNEFNTIADMLCCDAMDEAEEVLDGGGAVSLDIIPEAGA